MRVAGLILILVGMVVVTWGVFGFKTREKVLDAGSLHVTEDKPHHIPYGTLAGGLLVIGGVVMLVKSR
jgi:hypothetical protein